MRKSAHFTVSTVVAAILGLVVASSVHALPVIQNGGFESGFAFWTKADQLGSDGTFALQTGTLSPVNSDTVPAPPEGTLAAMTDSQGPGSHVLYQDFVATPDSATLSFALFLGNRDTDFFTPASLDFSTPDLNQQARVLLSMLLLFLVLVLLRTARTIG